MSGTTNVDQTDLGTVVLGVLGVSDDGNNLIVQKQLKIKIGQHLREGNVVTVPVYPNKTKTKETTNRDR